MEVRIVGVCTLCYLQYCDANHRQFADCKNKRDVRLFAETNDWLILLTKTMSQSENNWRKKISGKLIVAICIFLCSILDAD